MSAALSEDFWRLICLKHIIGRDRVVVFWCSACLFGHVGVIEMSEAVTEGPAPGNGNTAIDPAARGLRVARIRKHHILAAMGIGLVPVPLVDIVGLFGVNLDMIRKLCAEYEVPFDQERGRAILASLMSGLFPVAAGEVVFSLLKFVPLIGQTAGAVAFPVLAGATTYAVHNVS
jgi:uncharacterized protein (DUF697 family)